MNAREELAEVIYQLTTENTFFDHEQLADSILAAGYRKPRTITTTPAVTGAEWVAQEYREMLGASLKRVRQEHDPECPCGKDEALIEPIHQKEAE